MGDHDTLYTLLMPEFWARLEGNHPESFGLRELLGREWVLNPFKETHFTLIHVGSALIAFFFILFCAMRYRSSLKDPTRGVVPPRKWTLGAMTNNFVGATYELSADILGEDNARKFLPLIGTFALFIFCNNIQGLIPGLLPGTDTLKTNVFLALLAFVVYHVVGVKEQGLSYFAHFLGPKFPIAGINFPWLFPLLLPVEIFNHVGRPVSLSMRLMGNILADHKVVGAIMFLLPVLVPVPFLLLGTLVAIVQTLVFTILSVIYIGMALEHAEDH